MKRFFYVQNWDLKFYLSVALFLVLINLLGPRGVVQWVLVKQEARRLEQKRDSLKKENENTQAELAQFKRSDISKERAIREELGYLKPDEISIEFLPEDPIAMSPAPFAKTPAASGPRQ